MEIVCSVIPETHSFQDLINFYKAGMTSVRFNFSHADYDKTLQYIKFIRQYLPKVRIIQDIQGSKIRVSNLFSQEIKVAKHQSVYFCSEKFYLSNQLTLPDGIIIPISNLSDFNKIYNAKKIVMKDATMEFEVLSVVKNEIVETKVIRGGIVRAEKSINIIGVDIHDQELTEKDKKDIEFGINSGVDVISLSFTSTNKDLQFLKKHIKNFLKHSGQELRMPKICAKIETREGIDNIRSIVRNADILMLGRGDLYSETSVFEVAELQEQVVNFMKKSKKELIMATYLLESMKNNDIPSISEVCCLHNFLKNGIKSFMLVGEVTLGRNPIKVVRFLKSFLNSFEGLDNLNEIDTECEEQQLDIKVIETCSIEESNCNDEIEIEFGDLMKK